MAALATNSSCMIDRSSERACESACRASMAGYRVPKHVVWVDALPRNAYGKVLKRQLRELYWAASGRRI